jgi:hypothetical protein
LKRIGTRVESAWIQRLTLNHVTHHTSFALKSDMRHCNAGATAHGLVEWAAQGAQFDATAGPGRDPLLPEVLELQALYGGATVPCNRPINCCTQPFHATVPSHRSMQCDPAQDKASAICLNIFL